MHQAMVADAILLERAARVLERRWGPYVSAPVRSLLSGVAADLRVKAGEGA